MARTTNNTVVDTKLRIHMQKLVMVLLNTGRTCTQLVEMFDAPSATAIGKISRGEYDDDDSLQRMLNFYRNIYLKNLPSIDRRIFSMEVNVGYLKYYSKRGQLDERTIRMIASMSKDCAFLITDILKNEENNNEERGNY